MSGDIQWDRAHLDAQTRMHLEFFVNNYAGRKGLFPPDASLTQSDAVNLFKNFDQFLMECKKNLEGAHEKQALMDILHEILHFFNLALGLYPALSMRSGKLTSMIDAFIGGGSGISGGWSSYSIQFGLPLGISISFHYSSEL